MISPNDTYTHYLDDHLDPKDRKPDDHRPALVFRYGSVADLRHHETKLEELRQLTGEPYYSGLMAAVDVFLVSKRNLSTPEGVASDDLAEVLTLRDLKALAYNIPIHSELSEQDLKNFESPSPSVAAACAENASPDQADVSTPRPISSP